MPRSLLPALLLALLTSCGGGSSTPTAPPPPPPVDPGPATVVLVEPPTFQPIDNTYLRMTLHLKNTGGPGTYEVEVWRWGSGPDAEDVLAGRTEPVDVAVGYDETAAWQIYEPISAPPIKYELVFTRDQGSAQYRQTDRHDAGP